MLKQYQCRYIWSVIKSKRAFGQSINSKTREFDSMQNLPLNFFTTFNDVTEYIFSLIFQILKNNKKGWFLTLWGETVVESKKRWTKKQGHAQTKKNSTTRRGPNLSEVRKQAEGIIYLKLYFLILQLGLFAGCFVSISDNCPKELPKNQHIRYGTELTNRTEHIYVWCY